MGVSDPRCLVFLLLAAATAAAPTAAQVSGSVTGSSSTNGVVTQISQAIVQPEIKIYDCIKLGVPFMKGLVSIELLTSGDPVFDGLEAQVGISAPTTPEAMATWAITQLAGLSPPFPIEPCPPEVIVDYGKQSGNQGTYSFSIGSLFSNGPLITKKVESEMAWSDTLNIDSDVARSIALPVHIAGSILAAESFGTALTRGYAKLSMSGHVGAVAVDQSIEVESVSVIPEQKTIDVSELVQVPLSAGSNVINIQLMARAEVLSTAQGAGFIAGSATAGVMFSDALSVGRFVAADGSPLPSGVRITSTADGTTYEDTTGAGRWVNMGFALAGAAALPRFTGAGTLVGGERVTLDVSQATPGLPGVLVFGLDTLYFNFAGGVFVPSVAPSSLLLPFTTNAQGGARFSTGWPLGLPPGFATYFQVWLVDPASPTGFAATNALQATTPR